MQDRIEIPQIKLIYDIASAIISSESAMSAEESVAFLYNLRYANSVLYRQANYQRQIEIKTHMSPFGLFQSQGTSNYCGLCAINNIMGPAENGSFPVSVHEMDNTADLMWINMIDNPALGILERAEPLRDREGFYSYEVISALLEARGISLARISADAIEDLPPTEVHLLLLHQAKAEECDLLVRLKSSTHWLAIRVMRDRIFIMDSRQIQPSPLSIEDAAHFIKGHSRHPGAVDIVVKSKTTVTDQDMSEVKCEDNKRIPACPRDDRSEEGERYYELRKKPTQSMEDILRNTDKKDDLQSDKESSMKDMSTSSELEHDAVSDMSTSSELEHDVVSDMSMSSELERCWSSDVEQLQKDSPDNQEIGGSEEEEEEEEDDIDDDFSLEFADFEVSKLLMQALITVIIIVIKVNSSEADSFINDEADHERHHQFICNPETIYNKERKRVAFGFGVVSNKIISALLKYLTEELVYNHQVPFRFGGRRIRKLKNIELNNIFLKYKFFADNYVTFVLHKEAIIYFLQKTTLCPYEMGNEQCMEKEIDVNNEVQKKYRK
ncbi:unnamed protein product [Mytilus edulis]|uniref:ubiquitinyl hydrolase 1 n=1 Tax=Mytilus edulis TaxID=6550 RepID=A0A8S3TXK4_MYTED|nr:unnamed protein product [Mytilus edulis]